MRRLLVPGLLVLALVPAGCGGDDSPDSDEADITATIEGFTAALGDGDADGACGHLASQTLEDLEVPGSCSEVMTDAVALLDEKQVDIPDYEISDVTVDGDSAEATLISEATEDTVPLVKEDDKWLLLGITAMSEIHPDAPLESDGGQGEVGG